MSRLRKLVTVAASGLIAAASLAVSSPTASAGPSASPETLTFLDSGTIHVTSTTGQHLRLSISGDRFANSEGSSNAHSKSSFGVELTSGNGQETHQWEFHLAANSFTDSATGGGSVTTGSQIAPFGKLALTMSPVGGAHTQTCDTDNHNVIHHVRLKGAISFNTHSPGSHSWGSLPTHSYSFPHAKLTAGHGSDVEEACAAPFACQAGLMWNASHGPIDLLGFDDSVTGNKVVSHIEADRNVHLGTPAHAVRFDTIEVTAPTPAFASSSGHATLSVTTSGGVATGTAALSSTGHSPYSQDCNEGGHGVKGTLWNAHFQAGSTPLTFHAQIFGSMSIAKDPNAGFEKLHVT
jgi:hypothetical protein